METRKKVLYGLGMLIGMPIILLIMILFQNEALTLKERRILIQIIACEVAAIVLCCIPFVGYAAAIVLLVFMIIAAVNYFKGNFEYEIPLICKITHLLLPDEEAKTDDAPKAE